MVRSFRRDEDEYENDPDVESDSRYLYNGKLSRVENISGDDLPSGFYRFSFPGSDISIHRYHLPEQDQYINRSTDASVIREDMLRFFRSEHEYRDMNMAYRRGALVYGPPGTGKTFSILQTAETCVKEFNAVVFILNSFGHNLEDISSLRHEFRDRPTIFLLEEIAGWNGSTVGRRFLNFLDGELSWDRNYNVATTNYPGDLPPNIVDRPGRFDKLIEMNEPDREERARFLTAYLGEDAFDDEDLDRLKGFSISYLKEMALRTRLYDLSLKEVLSGLEDKKQKIKRAFQNPDEQVGFLHSQEN